LRFELAITIRYRASGMQGVELGSSGRYVIAKFRFCVQARHDCGGNHLPFLHIALPMNVTDKPALTDCATARKNGGCLLR
jgi:hypothetical protein